MRYQLVKDGVVHNTVVAGEGYSPPAGFTAVANDAAGPGWTYDGNSFSPPVAPAGTAAQVNAERDRRVYLPKPVALTSNKNFTCDMSGDGRQNIGDLGTAALAKMAANDDSTVSFRDAANQDHDLTNADIVEMGLQIMAQVQAIHIASRALKATDPIPSDYTADKYWP